MGILLDGKGSTAFILSGMSSIAKSSKKRAVRPNRAQSMPLTSAEMHKGIGYDICNRQILCFPGGSYHSAFLRLSAHDAVHGSGFSSPAWKYERPGDGMCYPPLFHRQPIGASLGLEK